MLKNRIKNYMENFAITVKAAYNIGANPDSLMVPVDELTKTTKYGYPIIHNNELLRNKNCLIAGMVPFYNIDIFGNKVGEPIYAIVVDDLFYKLSNVSQEFIIYHEIGHVVHNHMDGLDEKDYMSKRRNTTKYASMEIEADNYAAKHVGYRNAYHALVEMYELIRIWKSPEDKERLRSMKMHVMKKSRNISKFQRAEQPV